MALEIDEEVRKIIKSAYDKAKELLNENMDFLHHLSNELLEKETLRKEEFFEMAKIYDPKISQEDVENVKKEIKEKLEGKDNVSE